MLGILTRVKIGYPCHAAAVAPLSCSTGMTGHWKEIYDDAGCGEVQHFDLDVGSGCETLRVFAFGKSLTCDCLCTLCLDLSPLIYLDRRLSVVSCALYLYGYLVIDCGRRLFADVCGPDPDPGLGPGPRMANDYDGGGFSGRNDSGHCAGHRVDCHVDDRPGGIGPRFSC